MSLDFWTISGWFLAALFAVLLAIAVGGYSNLAGDLRRERNLTRRLKADLGQRYGADVASVRELRPGGDAA